VSILGIIDVFAGIGLVRKETVRQKRCMKRLQENVLQMLRTEDMIENFQHEAEGIQDGCAYHS